MPANVALGWLKFGVSVAATVLLVALLVPCPGGADSWTSLRYHIDYQLHRASQYAMRFNPHGTGKSGNRNPSDTSQSPNPKPQSGKQPSNSGPKTPDQAGDQNGQNHSPSKKSPPPPPTPAAHLYQLLKWLLWLGGAALIAWWIFRRREMLLQMWREFWAALAQFFRNLFGFRLTLPGTRRQRYLAKPKLFAEYQNPFLSGQETTLTPQQLILYSYEALQCWAVEQEITGSPEQTAREFCRQLSGSFSEIAPELNHLAFVHGHASYGTSIPNRYRPELPKQLWDYMSAARLQPAQVA
jgi:hypothetical protein